MPAVPLPAAFRPRLCRSCPSILPSRPPLRLLPAPLLRSHCLSAAFIPPSSLHTHLFIPLCPVSIPAASPRPQPFCLPVPSCPARCRVPPAPGHRGQLRVSEGPQSPPSLAVWGLPIPGAALRCRSVGLTQCLGAFPSPTSLALHTQTLMSLQPQRCLSQSHEPGSAHRALRCPCSPKGVSVPFCCQGRAAGMA